MAERVDVLDGPVAAAGRPRVDTGRQVGRPDVGLDRLVAVAVAGSGRLARHDAGAVEPDHAAVEDVGTDVKQHVIGGVHRHVCRVRLSLQILDPRCPPLDVDVGEDDAAAALQERALVARHVDRHGRQHVRVKPHVVAAGLVELRPHGRVFELQLATGVDL